MSLTYAQLVQAIKDETENYDTTFIDNIPQFVKRAEKKIYNAVKLPVAATLVFGNATASNRYLTMPSGFFSVLEVAVDQSNSWTYLLNKEVSFIREAYPSTTETGVPKYYAIFDEDTLLLAPTPAAGYTIQLRYYAHPESIVDAGSSWLGTHFEGVLLYGALLEAAIFMKSEQDVLESYGNSFALELELLKHYNGEELPHDAFRMGQQARRG